MTYRVVFMGTPEFAVPSLKVLIEHEAFEVVGVVTQPDRPAGRGQELRKSAVKGAAQEAGLPVFQPKSLRSEEAFAELAAFKPDVCVVAAFGQILRPNVLDLPEHGCINVHASLLPRWRGAAPIQYAIRAGDSETGVTIMVMDPGLDTGPMLDKVSTLIGPEDTASTIHDRLSQLGADLLPGTLLAYIRGEIQVTPQPEEGVTHSPTLNKEEGHIDWAHSAQEIDWLVRAFDPWPGTYSFLDGDRVKILKGKPVGGKAGTPGKLVEAQGGLAVETGEGLYLIEELQPAGKKPMSAEAFLAGRGDVTGKVLT